ncbi:MAG: hypothetical protein NW201_03825 [Gemmatimonadales bacterium]|nr:hypothetical protein [Gemmatimonadales bacterium]
MATARSADDLLLPALAEAARGPARDGLYALWLTARLAGDLVGDAPPPERLHRRRLAALDRRLRSLAVPPPLRRGLQGALFALAEATPYAGALALAQLAAPVRDTYGPTVEEAVLAVCPPGVVRGRGAQPASGGTGTQPPSRSAS